MNEDLETRYEFRDKMADRLKMDLYGPGTNREVLDERPLSRYVTGILWPESVPDNAVEIVREPDSEASEAGDSPTDSPIAGALVTSPVSAGFTFTIDSARTSSIALEARAARYERVDEEVDSGLKNEVHQGKSDDTEGTWRRVEEPLETIHIDVLAADSDPRTYELVPDSLQLYVLARCPDSHGHVTITAVLRNLNKYGRGADCDRDALAWFQVGISARTAVNAIVDRRSSRSSTSNDPDLRTSDLLYRHKFSFGSGHGCAADWDEDDVQDGAVSCVSTTFVPNHEVARAMPNEIVGVDLSLQTLSTDDRDVVLVQLRGLCVEYGNWIEERARGVAESSGSDTVPSHLAGVAGTHLDNAREALARMRRGIDLLRDDPQAFEAFRLANEAMHLQRSRQDWVRNGAHEPFELKSQTWRPFQIAFVLLNLPSLTDRRSDERDIADLLWFPAGGGKTEAYLALIAYLVLLRRLRDSRVEGTAVLMRYTLRLLTIQQFERAAMLICSLETIRRSADGKLGDRAFGIGLWVGAASTPNNLADARKALKKLENGVVVEESNPVQLHSCPWCGSRLSPRDYLVEKTHDTMVIRCPGRTCDFGSGLPVYVVDEDVYTVRPELVIGTVDKFARMAWDGRVATLFGRVEPNDIGPDLIVQDELHLISGPLGSTVGLFETAVDLAAGREDGNGAYTRPKLVASTATIRRAGGQIRAVFDRESRLFPPPGLNPDESFFASPAKRSELGTREYIGVMAPGTSHATLMVRVYASLLNSVVAEADTPDEIRDAYWTLVGYFNSLRVLGSAYLQVSDDVAARLNLLAKREGRESGRDVETQELTSRRSSSEIPATLKRLESGLGGSDRPLDVVLATNMISVGLDVDRLGLMTVMGQPPSSAEYIQATSRVGRKFPGLVVAIYNAAKSRDRSHYEGFANFHGSLYRAVEATSATPFADRSRDRALHAAYVSAIRMTIDDLRDEKAVVEYRSSDKRIESIEAMISRRSFSVTGNDETVYSDTKKDLATLSREWQSAAMSGDRLRTYVDRSNPEQALIIDGAEALINDSTKDAGRLDLPWATPQSMRDVDAETKLYPARMNSFDPNKDTRKSATEVKGG